MHRNINIPKAFGLQRQIEQDEHRFRVVACGRRWGKTFLAMREAFQIMLQRYTRDGRKQRGWVVAPTFPLVRESWMTAEEILKDAIIDKKQTEMKLLFDIGMLEFKSAERGADGLLGAGLDLAIMDEAKLISKESWEQGVRPALGDRQGKALFISTPKGRGFFYELFLKGKDSSDPQWRSWQYATNTNPYFPKEEWEVIKVSTPEMILKQEWLAEFLEDEASVFHNLSRCLRGELAEPKERDFYTIGIDLGKAEDFTVVSVLRNSDKQLVDIYRERRLDWAVQKDLIRGVISRYPKHLAVIDSTGLGDPIADDLRRYGVNIKDYKFTNKSKEALIEQLIIAIEQGLIGIPSCASTQFLIDELRAFNYEILPSRRIKYSAPEGLHDDGVISLALAVIGLAPLLYEQAPAEKERKKWGTADDWEAFYKMIDYEQRHNPFISRQEAAQKIQQRRWRRLLKV
jgi:hypothetical protein